MATAAQVLKLRRGTTAENNAFTGANAEVTVDTDARTLVIHDGVTAGGNRVSTAASLAGSGGADDVGFGAEVNYTARTLGAAIRDVAISLKAVTGVDATGATDCTSAINTFLGLIPSYAVLDGGGGLCLVTSLLIPSHITLRNARFKTKAGSTDFVAPITIDGTSSAKTDITLENLYIDGNRQNQTAIDSAAEDGGRHGIRVLGNVTKLHLKSVTAEYCAGDGMTLFSDGEAPASDAPTGLCFQQITMEDCHFNWNRRHGLAADSVNVMHLFACGGKNNGKDLDGSSALNHGMRGARAGGNLYGRPYTFEDYGVGTAYHNIEIHGGDWTENTAGPLFHAIVDPDAAGFQTRKNIKMIGGAYDASAYTDNGAIVFYDALATVAKPVFENVQLIGIDSAGWIEAFGVKGLRVSGRVVGNKAGTAYAALTKCSNYHFDVSSTRMNIVVDANPVTVIRSGPTGPTTSGESHTLIGFTTNGYLFRYLASIDGAGASYYMTLSAPAGYAIELLRAGLIINATGNPDLCSTGWADAATGGIAITLSGTGARNLSVVYEIRRNDA